jgi:hypothetical protein
MKNDLMCQWNYDHKIGALSLMMEGVYWVDLFFRLTFPDKSDYPVSHIQFIYHVLDSFPDSNQ